MTDVTETGPCSFTTRDGRRLHGERRGSGTPIVVFEAGMGASRSCWGAVLERVAAHTTAVLYDRSGLGRSEPDHAPRDLDRLRDDLLDVLGHLGDGPFVLVGHSWGGPITRAAAAARPDVVAGLVLVDPTDERCELFFSAANERQTRISLRLLPVLARIGVLRLVARRLSADLPEPWAAAMRTEDGTVAAAETQVAELRSCTDDLRRLRDAPPQLPDVPVAVISGTRSGFLERNRRDGLVTAHAATAAALPQGRHVRAEHSSHLVPLTDPALVADEVLAMARPA